MNNEQYSVFFKAMMTGLFVGIIDTLICLVYNITYRDYTGYIPSSFVNVSSIIFIVNLLLVVLGIVYFAFLRAFKQGGVVFAVVVIAVTIFLFYKTEGLTRFDDARLDSGFRGLLGGIVVILGLSTACIPLLYRSKRFLDAMI
jgi:hypothetical protein